MNNISNNRPESSNRNFISMHQQCYKQITKILSNWSTAVVRIVPGVMYQIRCGGDEYDPDIEYQINWFIDCSETFVHNHRNSFDSLCLEGEYTEKLWKIIGDKSDEVTYRFYRKSGNTIGTPTKIFGVLRHVQTRHHFPGNILHVDTNQYHSITPKFSSDSQVFTFLIKRKYSENSSMYILSSTDVIDAPSDEIRPATEDERQKMHEKLKHIFQTQFPQNNH